MMLGEERFEASAISSFRGDFELLLSSSPWDKTKAEGAASGKVSLVTNFLAIMLFSSKV